MGFPIEVAQTDNVTPADITATTSVQLNASGRIVVNTAASEWTDLHGGHVGVVVLLYQNGSPPFWLWTSSAVRYGLDGKWVGTSQITTSFSQTVDADTIQKTDYVVIKHYNAPNDAYRDIKAWLDGAVGSFGDVAALAKDISALKGA